MTRNQPTYLLEDVSHFYGDKKVLDIDHLEIPKGSITGLMGPNGSGKTTLLKILAFAMRPAAGSICFNGRPEYPFSPGIRSRVTMVTQKPYLLKRSVLENIAYGLKIRRDVKNMTKRIQIAMNSVGLDYEEFSFRPWHELSGGEAQRVALAARLVLKPDVLLLDEPVASVDAQSAALIRQASLAARENWGTTLVIASHDLAWLFDCSDTQISISNGTLFSTGMEIILPGPYASVHGQGLTTSLDDGQDIVLPPMTASGKTAVIQRENIHLATGPTKDNGYDNQMNGQILSMQMTGRHQQIMTTITVSQMRFMLALDPQYSSSFHLQPGKEVCLMFRSQDILWR
ncbi:MAG: energy-coupling factor ABC transporter ATP-binding protein [Desulfotignum sp.]|nr:ATP-binding cassette domain-containing protein [Desulfobacteraceae bacterium]